jgi:hypothetical protein
MQKILSIVLVAILSFGVFSSAFARDVKVKGYTRKDGTKVEGYTRHVKDKETSANTVKVKGYTRKDGTKVEGYERKKSSK